MVKAIKVLAILTFLAFAYAIIRYPFLLGETRTVDLAGLIKSLSFYLLAIALATLVILFFWSYPGFRGIKVFSTVLIVIYGYFIISSSPNIGDTTTWTPAYLGFGLFMFLLGLILAIWTIVYFKKMDQIVYIQKMDELSGTSDKHESQ